MSEYSDVIDFDIEEDDELDRVNEKFLQYLTFLLGEEVFGLEVNSVREVIEYENVYSVPNVPEYIRGVMNLRGDVVPVIDLSSLFYGKSKEVSKFTCIVIVEIEHEGSLMLIGIIIDAIKAVIDILEENIEATPGFGANIKNEYIDGVGKDKGKFIILLNLESVLDIDELSLF